MRYERKYRILGTTVEEWEYLVRQVPIFFRKSYPIRAVHNIYFDTINYDYLYQNIDGIQQRSKFRLRWYGDRMDKTKLEQKVKDGFLGFKNSFKVKDIDIQDLNSLKQHINDMRVAEELIFPVYYNRYKRKYFESKDGKFRVTLDFEQMFDSLEGKARLPQQPLYRDEALIIEIKYDKQYDREALQIIDYIPTRNTKNSKYVNGMWMSNQ